MQFPGVDGGKGTIEETPANVGSPNAMSKPLFGPKVGAWLTCIVKNYGSASLKDQGSFSGLKVNTPVPNLPPLTTQVQDVITGTKTASCGSRPCSTRRPRPTRATTPRRC